MKFVPLLMPEANPLKTASDDEKSTFNTASAPLLHAEMVPSSVEKRKCAVAVPVAVKPATEFAMVPDGAAVFVCPAGGGIVTTSDWIAPVLLYRVESPVPLSAIQNGLVALNEIPQGLTRFVSVTAAIPGRSETRLLCR